MRPDQFERIKDLAERLADAFIMEADPDEWPGAGTPMSEWSKDVRGDRHWTKKNAIGTGAVLRQTLDLLSRDKLSSTVPGSTAEEDDLDAQIRAAEKKATAAVNRALDQARKAVFDERVHGRKG